MTNLRSSDYVQLEKELDHAHRLIGDMKLALGSWTLNVTTSIESEDGNPALFIRVHKPNGQGFSRTISKFEAEHMNDTAEFDNLVDYITSEVVHLMYRDQVAELIQPKLKAGLANLVKVGKSSLGGK